MENDDFLKAIAHSPADDMLRLVYADWLEEHSDPGSVFLRAQVALHALPPDHPNRPSQEQDLSRLRKGLDTRWLVIVEPERAHLYEDPQLRTPCRCFEHMYENRPWSQTRFHLEPQDTECPGWQRLLELIDKAASDGRTEFVPLRDLSSAERAQVVTLPPTVARLKAVRRLVLYGSNLVRLPAEIGEMTALEEFDPYTSHRLHWFPYEITRCLRLRSSRVSTRALYGNYKYRPPFPRLGPGADVAGGRATHRPTSVGGGGAAKVIRPCSVCGKPFLDQQQYRVWISLPVATDVLPLLVNACSAECVARLPVPTDHYVQGVHRGGLGLKQPPVNSFYNTQPEQVSQDGAMTHDEMMAIEALLQQHDDPRNGEHPPGFDHRAAIQQFTIFATALASTLRVSLRPETDSAIQDASFHGQLFIPLGEERYAVIRVSTFGNMATISEDEPVAPELLQTVIGLLKKHGYVYVPAGVLEQPYTGKNPGVTGISTWWIRYFDWL
jgi:uncharacterized protein (TIGR02996 family)